MPTLEYASMPTDLNEIQVRDVAARQKAVIYCILANIALAVIGFGVPPQLKVFMLLPYLALVVVEAICFYRLASKFFHPVMAVLMMIVLVIPLIGLLVLLTVNGRATKLLQQNGVKVGLLGAKT